MITDEQRRRYSLVGWPPPEGEERCSRMTRRGTQCKRRKAPNADRCQQHIAMSNRAWAEFERWNRAQPPDEQRD